MDERAKAHETWLRLMERANHPSTPPAEAEVCRGMAEKLKAKWGFTEEAVREPAPAAAGPKPKSERSGSWEYNFEGSWEAGHVAHKRDRARYHMETRSLKQFGRFEQSLFLSFWDQAAQALRQTGILFDEDLILETSWERYTRALSAEDSRGGETWVDRNGRTVRIRDMSDLELALEIDRHARLVIEKRDLIVAVDTRESSKSWLSKQLETKDPMFENRLSKTRLELKHAEERLERFRAELARRSSP